VTHPGCSANGNAGEGRLEVFADRDPMNVRQAHVDQRQIRHAGLALFDGRMAGCRFGNVVAVLPEDVRLQVASSGVVLDDEDPGCRAAHCADKGWVCPSTCSMDSASRKAEDVLWHAQKLEAVGELTGGIAHDFNNLLAVIVLSMEMIRAAFEQDGVPARNKILRLLTASEAATERATTLTRQLLAFARRSTLKPAVVTLDEVIVGCEPFLRRALSETISFGVQSEQNLSPCRIDAAQVESVMLNLAVNARDAMPSGGQLRIAASNVTIDAKEALRLGELATGPYVLVKVTDTGTGMDADVVARAFEPFFTTKDVGKGTGLGLSQVYGFIKQSGGHV
jgi:signal transduction histidine kinase